MTLTLEEEKFITLAREKHVILDSKLLVIMELSPAEQYVINEMRKANPYEGIEIIKDAAGRPDSFLIKKQQKIMTSQLKIVAIR
jgi:hypothetical protein